MRIQVTSEMPHLRNIPASQREGLHLAGFSKSDLRRSWHECLRSVLEAAYPDDAFTLTGSDWSGPPSFHSYGGAVEFPKTETMDLATEMAGVAWLATLRSLCSLLGERTRKAR